MPIAHIVIDYQNVHLTGHDAFCKPGEAKELCLVHPLHFANQLLGQRNLIGRLLAEKAGADFTPASLGSVHVYRGQPSNKKNPTGYRRTQTQQSEWTRDKRVRVTYRGLKYYGDGSIKEKGIDVLVALELVTQAAKATMDDVVILAAHDTDLEPALEMAVRLAPGRVETAGWGTERILRAKGHTIPHTKLWAEHLKGSFDPRDYT